MEEQLNILSQRKKAAFPRRFLFVIGYVIIGTLVYLAGVGVFYGVSALLLMKNIVIDVSPALNYQRIFYELGFRNIWQRNQDCVTYDEILVYKPASGKCRFTNPEFDTVLTFNNEEGRLIPSDTSNLHGPAIAVVGDSFAMGWGVQDDETFAAVLQRETGRRVYNLAVSSYGTRRELLRLIRSSLFEKVETIIVQYCDNDLEENRAFQVLGPSETKKKIDGIFKAGSNVADKATAIIKGFALAIVEPLRAVRSLWREQDFGPHYHQLIEVIESFPELRTKRMIVFYVNPWGVRFKNYPQGFDDQHSNILFHEIRLSEDHFFAIDGHLTSEGHYRIAQSLREILREDL